MEAVEDRNDEQVNRENGSDADCDRVIKDKSGEVDSMPRASGDSVPETNHFVSEDGVGDKEQLSTAQQTPEGMNEHENDTDIMDNTKGKMDDTDESDDDDDEEYEDVSSGVETDVEDNDDDNNDNDDGDDEDDEDDDMVAWQRMRRNRQSDPDLPETVTELNTLNGSKVYIVGTAHFSESSQQDVATTIESVQPDVVLIELCESRLNVLQYDEKTLEEEAKDINLQKLRMSIKQSGLITGVMQILLLSMSAHLTKELGMAPGGEFRRAFHEAQKVPGCQVQLGDRPIQITLRRAMAQLSVWQKCKLAWHLLTSKESISKEDVEKCKQKDLLEEMLSEMTGEFPGLSRVFVDERDVFLAHSLQRAAKPLPFESGYLPSVVVGVVGMGHVPGIVENWNKAKDIKQLLSVPDPTLSGKIFKWTFRATLVGLLAWGGYRIIHWSGSCIYRTIFP
ncbi:traB domain-containing protein-like [Ptychodera flava]|uniref:traB domain-containing protein-like n=1 Tax=Ptychodera flava TaxID=63121 RepID=UPI00396A9C11